MTGKTILVTGGAGYIGSHVVKLLGQRGENIVVLDDLSTGFAEAVLYGELIVGNSGDQALVDQLIKSRGIDTVMHFAAHTIVPESVSNPLKYYRNNTACTRNLLEVCQDNQVGQFIFSSTAATYGIPKDAGLCQENSPTDPINPYGMSKLMSERMLQDLAHASNMRHVILRYFNVAGSDPDGIIGQSTRQATLLVKVAAEHAVGRRDKVAIFGTDYPTEDGTGIRDYIHVSDLASAHVAALDYLRQGGESTLCNAGYGHGYSVRQVLETMGEVSGQALNIQEEPRRAGDPPELVAAVDKIHQTLDWQPQYDDLAFICQTSLGWERKLQQLRGEAI